MNQLVQINNGWIAASIAAIVFDMLYPLALALFVRRRLSVGWRYFGYGALIFVLFQLISRVPITLAIQSLIAPQLQASRAALVAWIAFSALTAGVFEELGRYIGYRWLMGREEKTWAKGVMYGLGHGGIESMLLIAGLVAITLIQVLALSRTDLSTLPLTPQQRAQVGQQLAAIAAQPSWAPLLGAW
ncbi:MAG TPA: YhfC family glutamic-type intramembrane protease, partial [Roseiflexaceae bacterium]|nr:YhfC family glutamic-type intramembrane protease [Roseiflexaceae bacterium]